MRFATLTALISVTFASTFFAACSSDDSGGGNTGGKTTVGGSGGVAVGGAGGSTSGGAGGTTAGGAGGAGGTTATGSCKGICGSADEQPGKCYCDSGCKQYNDCCPDYATECDKPKPTVQLPAGCVVPTTVKTYCNPVTNEGCTGAGVACDFSSWGATPDAKATTIDCYTDSTVPGGQVCDPEGKKFCEAKHRCDGAAKGQKGVCKRYCCSNADCGGGTCKAFDAALGTIGVCDGGSDGGSDAGGDASTDAAADATSDAAADATPSDASGDATGD